MTTKLTLTVDQLALAVFTEEYRIQRGTTGSIDAIEHAFKALCRVAEVAPRYNIGDVTSDSALQGHENPRAAEALAIGGPNAPRVVKLAAFFAENGFPVERVHGVPDLITLTMCSGTVVNVWLTGSAVVQGKPTAAERRAIVELLRTDGWKVSG